MGRVTISFTPKAVRVSVSDNGKGFRLPRWLATWRVRQASPATGASANRIVLPTTVWNTRSPNASSTPAEHLPSVNSSRIVHGREHANDLQARVQPVGDLRDRVHQQRHAAQREVLAFQRHQHPVGGGERIHRQQTEARRAVDQQEVVAPSQGAQHPRRACSRATSPTRSTSAAARSMLDGRRSSRSILVLRTTRLSSSSDSISRS